MANDKKTLLDAVQKRLKDELTYLGEKVYVVASTASLPLSYHPPYAAVIYGGGQTSGRKTGGKANHIVNVFVFQAIWNEEFVITGGDPDSGENRSLTGLDSDAIDALRYEKLPEFKTGVIQRNFISDIISFFPTIEWEPVEQDGMYSASMGFSMNYGVDNET